MTKRLITLTMCLTLLMSACKTESEIALNAKIESENKRIQSEKQKQANIKKYNDALIHAAGCKRLCDAAGAPVEHFSMETFGPKCECGTGKSTTTTTAQHPSSHGFVDGVAVGVGIEATKAILR